MARYLKLSLFIFSLSFAAKSQNQNNFRFVGHVIGVSKDSFEKNDIDLFPSIPLPKLTQSRYSIEIRLFETDVLSSKTYCTIIYLDTIIRRIGFVNAIWEIDSTSKAQSVKFSKAVNLDSLFNILIKNGIFSLEDIDPKLFDNKLPPNYNPYILTEKGTLERDAKTFTRDGVYYFLEFKVGNSFNSYSSFINPEAYFHIYQDNQILRRQAEISSAIIYGRK